MLKNYFLSAVRTLQKQTLFTAINVFGLAIGLAFCILALGHLCYELSFEDMHVNRNRIYRVDGDYNFKSAEIIEQYKSARVFAPLGPAVEAEIPEVERVAMFRHFPDVSVTVDDTTYRAGNMICANPEFLDVFTFPLRRGNPKTLLTEPYSILITQSAAERFFPHQDPMGRIITVGDIDYSITGVLEDIPSNTQFRCDFISSYATLTASGVDLQSWGQKPGDYLYLLLNKSADPAEVQKKVSAIVGRNLADDSGSEYAMKLRPLSDIYLGTLGKGIIDELEPRGEYSLILGFGLVALFILIQAVAGFINLTTARSADRIKEVGIRKVVGANRRHLIQQFLGESILITLLSVLLGLVLYELLKGQVDQFAGRPATVDLFSSPTLLALAGGLVLVVGGLAGFYPALYISRFRPATMLQNRAGMRSPKSTVRRALVVLQFAIAICFTCCAVITYQQIGFIAGLDPGFNRDNMLVMDFEGENGARDCQIMKSSLLAEGAAVAATASSPPPGRTSIAWYAFYAHPEREEMIYANGYIADYDFVPLFGLKVVQGRAFSPDRPDEVGRAVLIDESSAEYLGMDNPIGKRLYRKNDVSYEIIGVVKDFLGTSKTWGRKPLTVIMLQPEESTTLTAQLPADRVDQSVAAAAVAWDKISPGQPFEYRFLDAEIDGEFNDIRLLGKIFLSLSMVTILIGCLCVFGLVSYTTERRTKEIGIRKVLGARVFNIVTMLSREFIILVIIANVIAWPVAYYLMADFISSFAYQTGISWLTFLLAGVASVILALSAAAYQSLKAAMANPADSLRSE